ncbi:hypothetical protein [Trueperella sp. LYQ141]|uniref:phage holin n=1 Tax=Trueperella sp. LYQ141 TaxID=3391058 RepID=UPI0039831708
MMDTIFAPHVRSWIYGIALAGLAILTAYGIVDQATSPLWQTLTAAILGMTASGTALAYRPTKHPQDAPDIPTTDGVNTVTSGHGKHVADV